MQHLKLTLPTPAENLALDEALLDAAEAGELADGVLRLWEMPQYCVILGRSSRADLEVNLPACRCDRVPVLRRSSGGGTVAIGPGCLQFSLVLDYRPHIPSRAVDLAHNYVLGRMAEILTPLIDNVSKAGTSDLVVASRTGPGSTTAALVQHKISGNALRMKRNYFLYHGTLLYDFDLQRMGRLLRSPPRQPDYRASRDHHEFVVNLRVTRGELQRILLSGWNADQPLPDWPRQRVADLVRAKYQDDSTWLIYHPGESSSRG